MSADFLYGIEVILNGLMAGVLYALVALGFVLIFKASGIFNYAQGVMALFAAVPSAIMGGSLRRPLHCCGIHNGGWEGRKQSYDSHPYKQYPYPIRASFSNF